MDGLRQPLATVIGRPPKRYLTEWRLTCAARLLRETDTPLAAITRRVGYSTEFALGHAFRRQFDVPPGRLRATGQLPCGLTGGPAAAIAQRAVGPMPSLARGMVRVRRAAVWPRRSRAAGRRRVRGTSSAAASLT
ncbi:hypothetical protein JCM9533A_09520 [Catenuloplanes niger JCM 9533]